MREVLSGSDPLVAERRGPTPSTPAPVIQTEFYVDPFFQGSLFPPMLSFPSSLDADAWAEVAHYDEPVALAHSSTSREDSSSPSVSFMFRLHALSRFRLIQAPHHVQTVSDRDSLFFPSFFLSKGIRNTVVGYADGVQTHRLSSSQNLFSFRLFSFPPHG